MPVQAALDGNAIFGLAVIVLGPNMGERRAQTNAYPGLDGLEELDLGADGMMTTVTGLLFGASESAVMDAANVLRSYWDGQAYGFTDNTGFTWSNVKVAGLQIPERGRLDPNLGWVIAYQMTLKHLTPS